MATFAESFWGNNGFSTLNKHMENQNECTSTILNIIHSRGQLAAEYAKGLKKITKDAASMGKDEVGNIKVLWNNLNLEMENEAKLYSQFADDLDKDVVKPLIVFRDEQKKKRSAAEKKVKEFEKTYSNARSNAVKAKQNALKKTKEYETIAESLDKVRGSAGEKDVAKIEKNFRKSQQEMEIAENEHRKCVKLCHDAKVKFEDAMLAAYLEFQTMEFERIEKLKTDVSTFLSMQQNLFGPLQQSLERLQGDIQIIDANADISTWVEGKATGTEKNPEFLYETYALDLNNPMSNERRKQLLEKQIMELETEIQSEIKGLSGIENLLKVYQEKPSYVDANGLYNSQVQKINTEEYLRILTDLKQRYENAFAQCGGDTSQIGSGLSSSQTFSTYSTSSYSSHDDYSTPTATGGGESGLYEALYDFAASADGELTVNAGERLILNEKTDAEWWTMQVEGDQSRVGFVPANYIQPI